MTLRNALHLLLHVGLWWGAFYYVCAVMLTQAVSTDDGPNKTSEFLTYVCSFSFWWALLRRVEAILEKVPEPMA